MRARRTHGAPSSEMSGMLFIFGDHLCTERNQNQGRADWNSKGENKTCSQVSPDMQRWDSTVFGPQTQHWWVYTLTHAHLTHPNPLPPTTTTPIAKPNAFHLNQLAHGISLIQDRKPLWRLLAVLPLGAVGIVVLPQQTKRRVRKRHYVLFLELSMHFFFSWMLKLYRKKCNVTELFHIFSSVVIEYKLLGTGTRIGFHCCSEAKSFPILCDSMDCSTPGFPVLHHLPELAQTHVRWVMPSNHLILCHPRLLQPSIFPSISVFSNKSALHTRWPNYWSFSFSISLFYE